MNFRHPWPAVLTAAALGLALQAEITAASTCKDELNRFESRLYGSALAASRPQLFQELAREAERAAELRDEQRCLERVAELNDALPQDDTMQPTTSEASSDEARPQRPASRPKAPTLLIADGEESADGDPAEEAVDEDDTVANNDDSNRVDD